MIDLHMHTIFSDGELIPSELARRAEEAGLSVIGITDHGDRSNIDFIVPRMVALADELNRLGAIRIIPGIELTHIPPSRIKDTAMYARQMGARIILVHGETIVEPVAPGTNRAALEADVDILAHPGLITEEEVALARERGIYLEVSGRKGHSLTNGHVVRLACNIGAKLIIGSDTHAPGDIMNKAFARRVAYGAGLTEADFNRMQDEAAGLTI